MSISKERELQCLTGMSKGLSDVEIGRHCGCPLTP